MLILWVNEDPASLLIQILLGLSVPVLGTGQGSFRYEEGGHLLAEETSWSIALCSEIQRWDRRSASF